MSLDILPVDQVVHGECLSVMRAWPDNCIDSAVLDPPAGISFMNKTFDHHRGGRDKWIAWLADIMREVLRVLRPGSHCLVWSLPRTSHWTGMALEQAGFEMRDCLYHLHSPDSALATFQASLTETQRDALERLLDSQEVSSSILHLFGSGFPKSLDVGKAVHKHLGVEREVVGAYKYADRKHGKVINTYMADWGERTQCKETSSSPELQQHEGIGSALKPACENWWLCRKPLSEKTIAENVLKHGTGGLNIDKSRVGLNGDDTSRKPTPAKGWKNSSALNGTIDDNWKNGRFPSNVTFSHSLFCTEDACAEGCPVLTLEQQSGVRSSKRSARGGVNNNKVYGVYAASTNYECGYNDTGTASRFYHCFTPDPFLYAAKASRAERNKGCCDLPLTEPQSTGWSGESMPLRQDGSERKMPVKQNTHPTVKSQTLMRYLVSLCTPANGIVLDCFAGSGSTLVAAITEGYHFIGIEMNNSESEPYVNIARARVEHALKERYGCC